MKKQVNFFYMLCDRAFDPLLVGLKPNSTKNFVGTSISRKRPISQRKALVKWFIPLYYCSIANKKGGGKNEGS